MILYFLFRGKDPYSFSFTLAFASGFSLLLGGLLLHSIFAPSVPWWWVLFGALVWVEISFQVIIRTSFMRDAPQAWETFWMVFILKFALALEYLSLYIILTGLGAAFLSVSLDTWRIVGMWIGIVLGAVAVIALWVYLNMCSIPRHTRAKGGNKK